MSELFLPNLFNYFGIYSLLYIATIVIGHLVSNNFISFKQESNEFILFYNRLMLGVVSIIALYAIYWTMFKTIYLLAVCILVVMYFSERYKHVVAKRHSINWKTIFFTYILFSLMFFIAYYVFFLRTNGWTFNDHNIYANLSGILTVKRVENTSLMSMNEKNTMYHYSDLWLTSLLSNTFRLNHLHVLLQITYPFIASIVMYGAFSLSNLKIKNIYISLIFGVIILIVKPFITLFIPYSDTILANPKLLIIPAIGLFSYFQIINRNYYLASLILLLLVPFYSAIAPGVLSIVFAAGFILNIQKESNIFNALINKFTISSIIVFALFALFYIINTNSSENLSILYENHTNRGFLFLIKKSARVLLLMLPPFTLLLILRKFNKTINTSIIFIMIIVFIGGLTSVLTASIFALYVLDGYQIYTNYADTIINIVILLFYLELAALIKNKFTYLLSIVLLTIYSTTFFSWVYQKENIIYSNKELDNYKRLQTEFNKNTFNTFAYFRNYSIKKNANNQNTRLYIYPPLQKLSHIIPTGIYNPVCLSVFDIPNNTEPRFDERKISDFWINSSALLKEGKHMSECFMKYIVDKKINYIIVEETAILPDTILNHSHLFCEIDGNKIFKITLK